MRIERLSCQLLAFALAAASYAAADYTGASGGNIAITFPTQGATLQEGTSYAITWNAAGLYSPAVSIKLLSLNNNQPDSSNEITISSIVVTSDGAYNWMVGQGFSGGNVIAIGDLFSTAYSPSFNIVPAAVTSSAINSTALPSTSVANHTTSRPPNSTHSSTVLSTAPPSSSATLVSLTSSSTSSFNSTMSGNGTNVDSSSPAQNPTPYVAVGVAIAVGAVASAVYVALRRTRRRRRPVSMPLIEESNETQDWSPPDWTTHNNVPSYRRPQPGYSPSPAFSAPSSNAGGYVPAGYYPDPAVPWASQPSNQTAIPTAVITETGIPAAATVAIPEDVHIREKTAVSSPEWNGETEAAEAGSRTSGSKPDFAG